MLFLRLSSAVVLVMASVALCTGGELRDATSSLMLGLLVGLPITRVAWLGIRWARLGDLRYALAAGALVLLLCSAAVL